MNFFCIFFNVLFYFACSRRQRLALMGDTHLEALLAEAEMLVDIRHDNCIRFYGITAADDGAYGLVTEYMRGGNLAAAIHTPKKAAELRYESTAAQGEWKGYWGDVRWGCKERVPGCWGEYSP